MDGLDTDALGRKPISDELKLDLSAALKGISPTKRGAFVLVKDKDSDQIMAHVAAKFGDSWKVAAGVVYDYDTHKTPDVQVAVIGEW